MHFSDFQEALWWYLTVLICFILKLKYIHIHLYKHIHKPSWCPSPLVFIVLWGIIYALQAQAAYWVQLSVGWGHELILYLVFLYVTKLWVVVFFSCKKYLWSLIFLWLDLVLSILVTVFYFQVRLLSGWFLVPTVLWFLFLSVLNWQIYVLNQPGATLQPLTVMPSLPPQTADDAEPFFRLSHGDYIQVTS